VGVGGAFQRVKLRRSEDDRLSYDDPSFHEIEGAPSGTSDMPDGGGGRIITGLVREGPF
jgi:hypothetical protein